MSSNQEAETTLLDISQPTRSEELIELFNSLQMLYTECRRINESRDPLLYACNQQIGHIVHEFLRHLNKRIRLKREDVGLHLKNMLALHHKTAKQSHAIAREFLQTIAKLFDFADLLIADHTEHQVKWATALLQVQAQYSSMIDEEYIYTIPVMHDFEKVKLLGYGGFASAYEVIYKPANIHCCMKIVNRKRLEKQSHKSEQSIIERVVAASVQHPLIVHDIACYRTVNAYITLMHICSGPDVDCVLNVVKRIPVAQAKLLIGQLFVAVEYLHYCGYIHRDIKPSNMLIEATGHILLSDFDLVKPCAGHYLKQTIPHYFSRTAKEFKIGAKCGTTCFMAPEIYEGRAFGRSSDFWSIGVTLFKLLSGYSLAPNPVCPEFRQRFVHFRALNSSANIPDAVDFMAKCFVLNPDHRIGSNNYSEIIQHPFLKDLALHELWRQEKIIADNVLEFTIKTYRSQNTIDMKNRHVKSAWKRHNIIAFENVIDRERLDDHKPLHTYITKKFKKLCQKLMANLMTPFEGSETFLDPETPPSKCIEYDKPAQADPILDYVVKEPLKTINIAVTRSRKLVMFWADGFDVQRTRAKSGQKYLFVTNVKHALVSSVNLLPGDIITSVNDRSVVGHKSMPLEGKRLILTVLRDCPSRIIFERRDMLPLLKQSKESTMKIQRMRKIGSSGNHYGLSIKTEEFWNGAAKKYDKLHLVQNVEKHLVIEATPENRIYIGDVLLQVGKLVTTHASNEAVVTYLAESTEETLQVEIKETSALRNV